MSYIAGGLLSGIGGMMQAQNEAENDKERANVARFNAEVAKQEAKQEMEGAAADSIDFRRVQMARFAAGKAAAAGSGFLMEGSPMLVNEAAVSEIEFGTSRIIGAGKVREGRLKTQAQLLTREAMIEDQNAKRASQAGVLNLFTGIVGGATNSYGSLLTAPSPGFGMA